MSAPDGVTATLRRCKPLALAMGWLTDSFQELVPVTPIMQNRIRHETHESSPLVARVPWPALGHARGTLTSTAERMKRFSRRFTSDKCQVVGKFAAHAQGVFLEGADLRGASRDDTTTLTDVTVDGTTHFDHRG